MAKIERMVEFYTRPLMQYNSPTFSNKKGRIIHPPLSVHFLNTNSLLPI